MKMVGKILKSIKKKIDKDDNENFEVHVVYICNSLEEANKHIKDLDLD